MAQLLACAAVALLFVPGARAGEKTMMHCFAWTAIKDATPADWQAFYQASDALPTKIQGITKVWYGKLRSPLSQLSVGEIDTAAGQKLVAGESVTIPVKRVAREYGMCMEMTGPDVLKTYRVDPYHKTWVEAYSKVRVEGTTSYDILGQ
jgi:hypothetical protein